MTLDKNTEKFNELQVDIDNLKQSNKILEKSHKFLSEKINLLKIVSVKNILFQIEVFTCEDSYK